MNKQALQHWRSASSASAWEINVDPDSDLDYLLNNMVGVLTIEKINYQSVILAPATNRNLDLAVCSVLSSRIMGQEGNYILVGHYSQVYGRHLNRIKEVEVGDTITVENVSEKFNYQVTEAYSVPPTETWVMANDGEKKLITVISCDYSTWPYSRWIVRGEITMDSGQLTVDRIP